jgi:hypothetical protein
MTFTLGTNHDQHYTCQCGQLQRIELPEAYKKHWICGVCRQQLIIAMDDHNGNGYTVTRQIAKTVQVGSTIVHRNGLTLTEGDVTQSQQRGGNPANWYLAVRGHGGAPIPANDYVNIEHNPFVNVAFTHP